MVGSMKDPSLGWFQNAIIRYKIARRDEEEARRESEIRFSNRFDEPGWNEKKGK